MTEHRSGLYSAPGIHTTTQSYYIRSFWKSNFFMPSARFCQSQCRGLNGNQFRVWILRNLLQLRYYSFPSLFHVHCSPYARGLGAACPYFRAWMSCWMIAAISDLQGVCEEWCFDYCTAPGLHKDRRRCLLDAHRGPRIGRWRRFYREGDRQRCGRGRSEGR